MASVGQPQRTGFRVNPGKQDGGHEVGVERREDVMRMGHDGFQRMAFEGQGAHGVRDVERAAGTAHAVTQRVHDRDVHRPVGKQQPVVEVAARGCVGIGRCVVHGEVHPADGDRRGPQRILQLAQDLPVRPAQLLVPLLQLDVEGEHTAVGLGEFVLEPVQFGAEGVDPGERGPEIAFERRDLRLVRLGHRGLAGAARGGRGSKWLGQHGRWRRLLPSPFAERDVPGNGAVGRGLPGKRQIGREQ